MFYVPLDWQSEAACRNHDPAVFFPADESPDAEAQITAAKAICWSCPVREHCLEYALAAKIEHGVWGGADEGERRKIRKSRRFGNPMAESRKAEASRLVGMGASVDDVANRLGISVRQARRLHDEASAPARELVAS